MSADKNDYSTPYAADFFSKRVADTDPVVAAAIAKEHGRQSQEIELIASENIASRAVLDAQGSVMTCLLYTSPSPRDLSTSRMPSSA